MVLLVVNDKNAQPLAMGSAFVVRKEVVATNYHVIEGGGSALATVPGIDRPLTVDGVLAADPDQDLALLRVPGQNAENLSLGTAAGVEIGATRSETRRGCKEPSRKALSARNAAKT